MDDMMLMQFVIDLFGADTIEMMKEEGLPTENVVNLSVREQYHIIQTYLDKTAEQAEKYSYSIAQRTDYIYNSNDKGYSLLSDSMKEKYETLEEYQNFIDSNLDKFSTVADKCNVRKKEGNNKIYTVIDKNNNTFIFTENAIMDYVVDFELNS